MNELSSRVVAAMALCGAVFVPAVAHAQTIEFIGPIDLSVEASSTGGTVGDQYPTAVETSAGVWVVWLHNAPGLGVPTVYAQLITPTGTLPTLKQYTPDPATPFARTAIVSATAVDDAVVALVGSPPASSDVSDPTGIWRVGAIDFYTMSGTAPMISNLGTFGSGTAGGVPVITGIAVPQSSGGLPPPGEAFDIGFGLVFMTIRGGSPSYTDTMYDLSAEYPLSSGTMTVGGDYAGGSWDTLRAAHPRGGTAPLVYLGYNSAVGTYAYETATAGPLASGAFYGDVSLPGFAALDALQSTGFIGRNGTEGPGTVNVMPLPSGTASSTLTVPTLPIDATQIAASVDTGVLTGAWIAGTSDAHGVVAATYAQPVGSRTAPATLPVPSGVSSMGSYHCAQPSVSAIGPDAAVVVASCGSIIGTSSHVVAWVVVREVTPPPDAGVDVIMAPDVTVPPDDVIISQNDTGVDAVDAMNAVDGGTNDDAEASDVQDAGTTPPIDAAAQDVYEPPSIAFKGGACNCHTAGTSGTAGSIACAVVALAAVSRRRRRRG